MAFVLVQHFDPHHESTLADLLGNYTRMPVMQVHGEVPVKPDRVYVIPPNATMVIVDGIFSVSRPCKTSLYQRKPIDAFFTSIAENMRNRAIGVILSGATSDGTLGLKAIKAEGGITFAQDTTAKFDGMPRSAVASGLSILSHAAAHRQELAAIPCLPISRPTPERLFDDSTVKDDILEVVRRRNGVDFGLYKQATIPAAGAPDGGAKNGDIDGLFRPFAARLTRNGCPFRRLAHQSDRVFSRCPGIRGTQGNGFSL